MQFSSSYSQFWFSNILFRILLVLAQKDVLNLSAERTMSITEVTLCLGNLQFGFANNNVTVLFLFSAEITSSILVILLKRFCLWPWKLAQWRKNWLVVLGPFPLLHMRSNLLSFKWLNLILIRVRLFQGRFMNFINTVSFGCNKN